jgi:hypothetical protein
MVEAKTAVPVGFFCAMGALCSDNPAGAESANTYGRHVGMALQLYDDLEGIWGEATGSMEPHLSDLRTRKKIPVVAFCLHASGPGQTLLADYYRDDTEPDETQLRTIRSLIEDSGGRTWLETRITHHLPGSPTRAPPRRDRSSRTERTHRLPRQDHRCQPPGISTTTDNQPKSTSTSITLERALTRLSKINGNCHAPTLPIHTEPRATPTRQRGTAQVEGAEQTASARYRT